MARNQILNAAKASKKDEFYTSLEGIDRELRHYTHHFQGKRCCATAMTLG